MAAGKANSRRVVRGECSSCTAPMRLQRPRVACLVSPLLIITGLLDYNAIRNFVVIADDLLVTKQTGEAGRICNSVMITERKYTRKEFYIAFMNERAFAGPVMIASSEGGVNIEEVAEKNPDAIVKFPISINDGLSEAEAKDAAAKLGFPADRQDEVAKVLVNLYQLFLSKDATMVEINPFAEDSSGECKKIDGIEKLKFVLTSAWVNFRFLSRRQDQVR